MRLRLLRLSALFIKTFVVLMTVLASAQLSTLCHEDLSEEQSDPVRLRGDELVKSALVRVDPKFPTDVELRSLDGRIIVELVVDESGSVDSVRPINGNSLCIGPAIEAARQWKFRPAQVDGKPVKAVGTLTFFVRGLSEKSPEEIRRLEAEVTTDPKSAIKHFRLGMAYKSRMGRSENDFNQRALSEFRKTVELDPHFALGQYELGLMMRALDQPEEALRAFAEAVRIKPDLTEAYYNLAGIYEQVGKIDEAISQWKKIAETCASLGVCKISYTNLERIYRQKGRHVEQLQAMEKLIENGVELLTIEPHFIAAPHVYSFMQESCTRNWAALMRPSKPTRGQLILFVASSWMIRKPMKRLLRTFGLARLRSEQTMIK